MADLSASAETLIARPPDAIWPYVGDPCNQDEWVDGMRDSEIEGGGEPGAGAVIRGAYKGGAGQGPVALRITAFEPERRLATEAFEGLFLYDGELTLEREADGTRVRNTMTVQSCHWATAVLFVALRPLMAWCFRRQMRKDLAQLKAILEAR